jgi:hypothetical protein
MDALHNVTVDCRRWPLGCFANCQEDCHSSHQAAMRNSRPRMDLTETLSFLPLSELYLRGRKT